MNKMATFSKAKLKRFNDVDVVACASPSRHAVCLETNTPNPYSSCNHHGERKEHIEKFLKENGRSVNGSKESTKEDKKSKGLRLFRTPSLPHRLRFRQNSDSTIATATSATTITASTVGSSACGGAGGGISTSAIVGTIAGGAVSSTASLAKEVSKSGRILKSKDALQQEIRNKNELIENYLSQMDVLKRHIEQLKESEAKLREEHVAMKQRTENAMLELESENTAKREMNDQLIVENARLAGKILQMEEQHVQEVEQLMKQSEDLRLKSETLETESKQRIEENDRLKVSMNKLEEELQAAQKRLTLRSEEAQQHLVVVENLKNRNDTLMKDMQKLREQMEQDALSYAQETKTIQTEMESLKNERNTLKSDLANKCDLINSLKDELLDKNCEIDAHCDTIRQLCSDNAKYAEREKLLREVEEKLSLAERNAEERVHKIESDMENALEKERNFWRSELEKRQKMAENEVIKIELEKQDVMVLLETTNDMLRERDEKIQKYEEQLRNGIDYYIQLTDNLQKQVVTLKQDMAKTITEKYNYQLTLNNTRSTVNILMERLKKSDADVDLLKAELETVQVAKASLKKDYDQMQDELEKVRQQLTESETALDRLRKASETLQKENIDEDSSKYLEMYNELKSKDETRELYMQEMKRALDEFATVLQYAQLELDNKENNLEKMRDECEQLKLENIALKSKLDDTTTATVLNNAVTTPNKRRENSTDIEKIEGLLIDSDLRSECDKIAAWLLNSSNEKSIRHESSTKITELLKAVTPNQKKDTTCQGSLSASKKKTNSNSITTSPVSSPHTPRTPRTPKTAGHASRMSAKKVSLFPGKENVPNSPQKQILKARNV